MAKTTRVPFGALLILTAICVMGGIPASAIAAPMATTEAATAVSYEQATLKGTVNPEGSATSYWFEYGKTEAYGTKIPVSPASVGSGTSNVAVSQTVTGFSQSTEYHFRVVAEGEAETVKGADATFTTAGFNFSFGEEGSGNGQLKQPELGIVTDAEGNIWIADTGNNRIQKFNSKGEYLAQFGKVGTGNGEFKAPEGLAIDSEGNIWVVDTGNNRIQKFNSKGEYLLKCGEEGSGEGQFKSPSGIALDFADRPFVVDTGNNRVQKFNSTCKYLAQVGKEGTGNGEFKSPTGIVIDPAGRMWVTDTGNNRVERFTASTLNYMFQFGKEGSGDGQFKGPTGIGSDFQERLWVVDSGNNRAQKFSATAAHLGEYLDRFGKEGAGAGQLSNPTGITTPAPQKVLILDTGNNRVQSWTVKAEPPTVGTSPATNIKVSSAALNATINPEGLATNYWFEYGKTEAYGTKIPVTPESIGSGLSNVQVSQPVVGLSEGTIYHFRALAENEAGVMQGIDRTFKTLKIPKVTTEAATAVKATQATLNAKVNPEGSATSYWFEYGKTEAYGTKIPVSPASVGSGTSNVAVSQTPIGLSEGTTYHFRVVAESEAGSAVQGVDKTLTTLKLPKVTTEAATAVKLTQVNLNAVINPEGFPTSYYFEYGTTEAYGVKEPISPESIGSGTSPLAVSQTPAGLSEGTTYHYRVVAESEGGIVKGGDKTVKTLGPPKVTTEAATAVKATQATMNAKVNPEGSATSYWFEYGPTTSYGTKIPVSPESVGSGTSNVAVSQTPIGLNRVTTYHFRVVAESGEGVSKGTDKTFTTVTASLSLAFGLKGTGNGQFRHPAEIAVDVEGNPWVVDYENNRLQKFDKEGKYLTQFGEEGSEEGQLLEPTSIAIDAEGGIWVADAGNSRLEKFDKEGKYLTQFGEEGSEEGQLLYPESIAIDAEGDIWVADTYNSRLQKFDAKGNLLEVVGAYGSEPGQLGLPTGIDVGPGGNVWVADWENQRIAEFDEAGEFVQQFGKEGSGNGQFAHPDTIDVDEAGNVWVVDEENGRVQEFDEKGEYLGKFELPKTYLGLFSCSLTMPTGITTDAKGSIWVSLTGCGVVEKWVP